MPCGCTEEEGRLRVVPQRQPRHAATHAPATGNESLFLAVLTRPIERPAASVRPRVTPPLGLEGKSSSIVPAEPSVPANTRLGESSSGSVEGKGRLWDCSRLTLKEYTCCLALRFVRA